ncbi:MAG: type II secretion system F family protein, partial [Thermoplasmata archaeon]
RIKRQVKLYTRAAGKLKLSLWDKLEIRYIDRSNIRRYLPFFNLYILFIICSIIFIVLLEPIYKAIYSFPGTAIISFIFCLTPFFLLDILGKYNSEIIRQKLADFISVLSRWCTVKNDIFFAFEKAAGMGNFIGEPLKTYIFDMVSQIKYGVEPDEALDILSFKVDNPQFKDFIVNIKQNIKHRGDTQKLLSGLEEQYFRLNEEFHRRRISTFRDRVVLYFITLFVPVISYAFITSNDKIFHFYTTEPLGKALLSLFCIMYACGVIITSRITGFDY